MATSANLVTPWDVTAEVLHFLLGQAMGPCEVERGHHLDLSTRVLSVDGRSTIHRPSDLGQPTPVGEQLDVRVVNTALSELVGHAAVLGVGHGVLLRREVVSAPRAGAPPTPPGSHRP